MYYIHKNMTSANFRKEQIEVMFREVYLIVCLVGNNVKEWNSYEVTDHRPNLGWTYRALITRHGEATYYKPQQNLRCI